MSSEDGLLGGNSGGLLSAGARVGSYVIERQIGEGGMAVVYEGRHQRLGKRVAIKMLLPTHAMRADVARRFLREGESAAKLAHPHVVDVTDVGVDERGSPYLVMEYLEGEDLAAYLQRAGKLQTGEIADLMLPVMSAIVAAHQAGIVHRDLKPQNIFLCRSQGSVVPKVLDFGISKVLEGESLALTGTDALLGTPYYMSPEQAQGAKNVDPRADEFSLGVILYECITGRRPFEGESLYSVLTAIIHSAHEPPSKLSYPMDPAFEALVNRALRKLPGERFPSVRELGQSLLPFASTKVRLNHAAEFGESDDVPSAPPSQKPQPRASAEPKPSRPVPWLLAGLVAVAVLGVGATFAFKEPSAEQAASTPPPLPGPAPKTATALEPAPTPTRAEEPEPPVPVPAVPVPTFAVSVRAHPSHAKLFLDEELVGEGQLERTLPRDGREHTLRVTATGYRAQSLPFRDIAPPGQVSLVRDPVRENKTLGTLPGASTAPAAAKSQPAADSTPAPNTQPASEKRGVNSALIIR